MTLTQEQIKAIVGTMYRDRDLAQQGQRVPPFINDSICNKYAEYRFRGAHVAPRYP